MGNKSRLILMICSFFGSFTLFLFGIYIALFEARGLNGFLAAIVLFFIPSALLFWNFWFLKSASISDLPRKRWRAFKLVSLWMDVKTAEFNRRLEKETDS